MTVRLHLTRDSVAMADDVYAPHEKAVSVQGPVDSPEELQAAVASVLPDYLPNVVGRATWVAYCGVPLLVTSNDGAEPRFMPLLDSDQRWLERTDDGFRVNLVYLATSKPKDAFEALAATLCPRS